MQLMGKMTLTINVRMIKLSAFANGGAFALCYLFACQPCSWWLLSGGLLNFWCVCFEYSIKTCSMCKLKSFYLQCQTIMAGWCPNPKIIIAANTVLYTVGVALYQIPKGISIATSIRVGNALGQPVNFHPFRF